MRRGTPGHRLLWVGGALLAITAAAGAGCLAALLAPRTLPVAQPVLATDQQANVQAPAERPLRIGAVELNDAAVSGLERDFRNPDLAQMATLNVRQVEAREVWLELDMLPGQTAPRAQLLTSTVVDALHPRLAAGTRLRVTCLSHLGDRLAERIALAADPTTAPDSYDVAASR